VYPSHRILDLATRRQLSHCYVQRSFFLTRYLVTPYFVPSRRASRASCYTVPPWFANASANTSLPISTGAEEIARAIRVSPHSTVRSRVTISTAGSNWFRTREMTSTFLPPALPSTPSKSIRRSSRASVTAKQFPNLTVVPGDILKADLAAIASGRRMRIYGNLPYYITSPILHHLFTFAGLIDEIHIVIQTEVALRLAAQPGTRDYGYLSVVTQFYTRPEFVFEIPRDAFEPRRKSPPPSSRLRLPGERAKLAFGSSASSAAGAPADSSSTTHLVPGFCEIVFLAEAQDAGQ